MKKLSILLTFSIFLLFGCLSCSENSNGRKHPQGTTTLHHASGSGDIDEVRELISEGADVNAKNANGNTPLYFVSYGEGNVGIAKLLIDAGAEVNARDNYGNIPLHIAIEFRKAGVVKVFIEAGAYVCYHSLSSAQYKLASAKESIIWHKQKSTVSIEFLEKKLKNSEEIVKLLEAEMKKQGCLEASGETHPTSK